MQEEAVAETIAEILTTQQEAPAAPAEVVKEEVELVAQVLVKMEQTTPAVAEVVAAILAGQLQQIMEEGAEMELLF
jgi:hypothetical protein